MLLHSARPIVLVGALLALLPATARAAGPGPVTRPSVGSPAADFVLPTPGGQDVSLAALRKDGPVVVVVLRGWPGYQCPICTKQVGELMAKADAFAAAKARVVLVYPGPAEGLKASADEFRRGKDLPANVDLVLDPGMAFVRAWGLRWEAKGETAYPSTFVIGADGRVRYARVSNGHGGRAPVDEVVKALAPAP